MSGWRPADFDLWPTALPITYGPYRARVKHIVDGDTFDAFVDLGGRSYQYWRVRLLGVNTPEKNKPAEKARAYAAQQFVSKAMPVGTPVILADTAPDPDVFGRWLSRVLIAPDVELGQLLLDAGHAVPWED